MQAFYLQNYGKLYCLICALCLLYTFQGYTQGEEKTVSGKVTEETGDPIPGVNVLIKGTSTGTVTDADGNYSLQAAPENTLVFTSIGFTRQEIPVGNQTTINVQLITDVQQLSEVVVVGYGQQARRDLTSAVVSVRPQDIENVPLPSIDGLIQGRAAGVRVTSLSGAPGAGVQVRIRGNTSITAGNDPLYVIDGIPMRSESFGSPLAQTDVGNNVLADISPDNIASIEIMKDAAASAIYGARAANGVVLITTKRGSRDQTRLSFNSYVGIQQSPEKVPLLNGEENKTLLVENNLNGEFGYHPGLRDVPGTPYFQSFNNDTDWQEVVLRNGVIQNYNLSLSGGDQKTRYFLSLGYFDQTGIVLATDYDRINARINVDYDISPKARIGNSTSFSRSNSSRMDEGPGGLNILRLAQQKPAYHWIYAQDEEGNDLGYFGGFFWPPGNRNPLQVAEQLINDMVTNRVLNNIFFEYDILDNLTFRTNFGIDFTAQNENRFIPAFAVGEQRIAREQHIEDLSWINENILTYNETFGSHTISAMLGYSQQESKFYRLFGETRDHPSNTVTTLNAGPTVLAATSEISKWGINSILGRVGYIYDDRYSVSFNIRRDGSSRFGENNKYATFPSASMYWRLSSEPFMTNATWIGDLKFRASYGQTGNQGIGNYASRALYVPGTNYLGLPGVSPQNVGIPNLSWETTTQLNIGLDFTVFNDRLTFIADYYKKSTENLLLNVNLPTTSGFTGALKNIGDTENEGFELAILGKVMQKGDFSWDMDFNIARNKNRIVNLPEGNDIFVNQGGFIGIGREGEEIGTFYGWRMLGVFPRDGDALLTSTGEVAALNPDAPLDAEGRVLRRDSPTGLAFAGGDIIWEDVNKDGIIDDDDLQVLGKVQPELYGGFNNTFQYKGFQLNVFFQFQYGNDVINAARRGGESMSGVNNQYRSTINRWRKQGDITDIPLAIRGDPKGNSRANSSRWVEDGSYLRLKTVTLAYNLPADLLNNIFIRNAKIYVTGQNLLTFTEYLGVDPEFTSNLNPLLAGIDDSVYPQPRTVTVGVNIGF